MIIIGAGLSGLLAGQYFRHHNPIILEKQDSLPNNHKALLRFRTSAVSDLTGIPFKKVKVQKMAVHQGAIYDKPNLFISNLYSQKVSGVVRSRSISNLDDCERYIAPEDFIQKASHGLDIKYNQEVDNFDNHTGEPIISTMPVFALAEKLGYKGLPSLKSREIWTVTFDLSANVDVYQTVYYPDPKSPLYRLSITGKKVIAEFCDDITGQDLEALFIELSKYIEFNFGIPCQHPTNIKTGYQKYGKLVECETNAVKEFIGWATHKHNIYSLGRWGTHRQILMDDVVSDLKKVDRMIRSNNYER